MEEEMEIQFDDRLVKLFWSLHRFKCLQWIILQMIRIREKFDLHKYVKTPVMKEVDEMDNCHFRTLYKPAFIAFADNYTDPDFLCSMQVNTNLKFYSLGDTIQAATRVILYLCPCVIYGITYYHLSVGNLTGKMVFLLCLSLIVSGYGIFQVDCAQEIRNRSLTFREIIHLFREEVSIISDAQIVVCCCVLSYCLIPILRTMTATMDGDSVHVGCYIMFCVHLFTNNYGLRVAWIVCQPLALNSAILSMVCLSSRLSTDSQCMSLLAFGGVLFICYPEFVKVFWKWRPGPWIVLVVGFSATLTVSSRITLFFLLAVFIVLGICPLLYVWCIHYKLNLWGPWDEALVNMNVNVEEIEKGFEKRENDSQPSTSASKSVWGESPDSNIAEMEAKGIGLTL